MELLISILSLAIGSIVTWLVSKWYYRRSKDDFAVLLSKIDKILVQDQIAEKDKTETTKIKFWDEKFKDPKFMDSLEEAIFRYVKTSGPALGFPGSGLPIFAIEDVIKRVDRIKQSLESYKEWRVHVGA